MSQVLAPGAACDEVVEQVRAAFCGYKRPYGSRAQSRHAAERLSAAYGVRFSHYRCPLCHHRHVARAPSIHSVQVLACVLRGVDPRGRDMEEIVPTVR